MIKKVNSKNKEEKDSLEKFLGEYKKELKDLKNQQDLIFLEENIKEKIKE